MLTAQVGHKFLCCGVVEQSCFPNPIVQFCIEVSVYDGYVETLSQRCPWLVCISIQNRSVDLLTGYNTTWLQSMPAMTCEINNTQQDINQLSHRRPLSPAPLKDTWCLMGIYSMARHARVIESLVPKSRSLGTQTMSVGCNTRPFAAASLRIHNNDTFPA